MFYLHHDNDNTSSAVAEQIEIDFIAEATNSKNGNS